MCRATFFGWTRGASARLVAAAAAGLFLARQLGELVPDALAIGVSMFAAGYLAGLLERRTRAATSRPSG
jgi:hypothetical protein